MADDTVQVNDISQLAIGTVMSTMSIAHQTATFAAVQTAADSRNSQSLCFGKLSKDIAEHDIGEALGLNKANNGMVDFAAQFAMGQSLANAGAVGSAQGAKVAYATVPSNEKAA